MRILDLAASAAFPGLIGYAGGQFYGLNSSLISLIFFIAEFVNRIFKKFGLPYWGSAISGIILGSSLIAFNFSLTRTMQLGLIYALSSLANQILLSSRISIRIGDREWEIGIGRRADPRP